MASLSKLPVVDMRQFADRPADDLFRIGAEHATECGVRLHDALTGLLRQHDAEWAFLKDTAKPLLALR